MIHVYISFYHCPGHSKGSFYEDASYQEHPKYHHCGDIGVDDHNDDDDTNLN